MEMKDLDSSKIKILVCCHKPCDLPKDDIFLPIQVGAAISKVDLGIQRDDQLNGQPCDNISAKNQSYCELTAIYWAWKNIKKLYPDLEYIGLNHYRRFFAFDDSYIWDDAIVKPVKSIESYRINHRKLGDLLKKGYVIVAKRRQYPYSLNIDYSHCHISDDLRTLNDIIHHLYPDYDDAFYNVLMRNNALAHYNICVMEWQLFDEYCNWLFSILSECEKRIDITYYNPVQKRIFGYMAERLFNVYTYKNFKKVKRLNVYKFDDSPTSNSLKQDAINIRNLILGKLYCWSKIRRHIRPVGK